MLDYTHIYKVAERILQIKVKGTGSSPIEQVSTMIDLWGRVQNLYRLFYINPDLASLGLLEGALEELESLIDQMDIPEGKTNE